MALECVNITSTTLTLFQSETMMLVEGAHGAEKTKSDALCATMKHTGFMNILRAIVSHSRINKTEERRSIYTNRSFNYASDC